MGQHSQAHILLAENGQRCQSQNVNKTWSSCARGNDLITSRKTETSIAPKRPNSRFQHSTRWLQKNAGLELKNEGCCFPSTWRITWQSKSCLECPSQHLLTIVFQSPVIFLGHPQATSARTGVYPRATWVAWTNLASLGWRFKRDSRWIHR